MNRNLKEHSYINELIRRYPSLEKSNYSIQEAYETLKSCFENGNKLLVAGNGGSTSDAQHIAAELMKGFEIKRCLDEDRKRSLMRIDPNRGERLAEKLQEALPVIALDAHTSLNTAFANDVDPALCFAQQINGYGREGDVFLAISTSGNSENIIYAAVMAQAMGIRVIGFTGEGGGRLAEFSDVLVSVPRKEAFRVQELQLPIYHCWCRMLEQFFFGD